MRCCPPRSLGYLNFIVVLFTSITILPRKKFGNGKPVTGIVITLIDVTMGKCEGGGSAVLERPLKLWSLVIDSVRCGGGGGLQRRRKKSHSDSHSGSGSEKLSDLLKQPEWWDNEEEEEVRRKEQVLQGLKNVARKLLDDGSMVEGAVDVRRLTKDDPHARTTLALLGVIPPLLSLLDALDPTFRSQIAALYALLNLAITNDANKAAIVKAGAIHKMLKLIESGNEQGMMIAEAVVANFLGLSALDSNKAIIGCSGAIPFLVKTLTAVATPRQAKQDSLRALYNLSISPTSNVVAMLETDLVPYLVNKVGDMDMDMDMDMSERILSILGNVVSVAEGRKRIGSVVDAFPILMDVLNWIDSPGCQEKATYILMVMAHKSYGDRQAMIEAGIVSSLLELTLLGTTLAQKRASRMLECFKGKQLLPAAVAASSSSSPCSSSSFSLGGNNMNMSAPLSLSLSLESSSSSAMLLDDDEMMMSQENKAVKQLVQQSLHNNMNRMVKRANLPHDFVPSHHLRSLTSSSTSKSLPF